MKTNYSVETGWIKKDGSSPSNENDVFFDSLEEAKNYYENQAVDRNFYKDLLRNFINDDGDIVDTEVVESNFDEVYEKLDKEGYF